MGELLYKDLSYKVIGLVYNIYNNIGFGYREKYYQRALAIEFDNAKISYKKELPIKLKYGDTYIGKYFIDFVVDDKIVIELKIANDFYTKDIKQLLSYLKVTGLRLGILIILNKDGVKYKRFVN